MFNKLRAFFEFDRCMFSKKCELYKKGSGVCNDWLKRFPTYEKAYCGKYRGMEEGGNDV